MALSLLLIVLLLIPNKLHSQSDATSFDFTIFDGKETNLVYQGDAHIPTDRPPGVPQGQTFIRLTSAFELGSSPFPLTDSVGRVLYSPPVRLWDRNGRRHANFQTVITGFIGNSWSNSIGDGIAFFMSPVDTTIPAGSTRGHMGLYGSSGTSPVPLFAVELDVALNSWDPFFLHAGINVNSRTSLSVANWQNSVGGGNSRLLEARITYDARHRVISVLANSTNDFTPAQPIIARVEHTYDLRTLLPEWVQIGISASTGQFDAALQEVRAWSFVSFMVPDDDDITGVDHNDSVDVQDT